MTTFPINHWLREMKLNLFLRPRIHKRSSSLLLNLRWSRTLRWPRHTEAAGRWWITRIISASGWWMTTDTFIPEVGHRLRWETDFLHHLHLTPHTPFAHVNTRTQLEWGQGSEVRGKLWNKYFCIPELWMDQYHWLSRFLRLIRSVLSKDLHTHPETVPNKTPASSFYSIS